MGGWGGVPSLVPECESSPDHSPDPPSDIGVAKLSAPSWILDSSGRVGSKHCAISSESRTSPTSRKALGALGCGASSNHCVSDVHPAESVVSSMYTALPIWPSVTDDPRSLSWKASSVLPDACVARSDCSITEIPSFRETFLGRLGSRRAPTPDQRRSPHLRTAQRLLGESWC